MRNIFKRRYTVDLMSWGGGYCKHFWFYKNAEKYFNNQKKFYPFGKLFDFDRERLSYRDPHSKPPVRAGY